MNETRLAIPYDEFVRHLRAALHHLYDPSQLRHNPLAGLFTADGRSDRATTLQGVISDAIGLLQPKSSEPPQSRAWRIYDALYYRYVRQQDRQAVADQLGISGRQLRREQLAAIEVLAEHLWREYSAKFNFNPASLTVPTGMRPVEPDPANEQDFAWLRQAVPETATQVKVEVQSVLQLIERMISTHAVRVEVELAESLPELAVPPVAFRQMLLSLLSVAIPYAQPGVIAIAAVLEGYQVKLTLAGHRPVPQSLIPNSGIEKQGLEMASRLAELCDGAMRYTANPGSLYVELTLPALGHLPVLVVDDNADASQLYQRYVAGTRFSVTGIQEPRSALALAQKLLPHVIVLDVMMPEIDGWEILALLRQEPATSQVPVVVCSILPQETVASSLGANAFLRKPISRLEFLATLDAVYTRE